MFVYILVMGLLGDGDLKCKCKKVTHAAHRKCTLSGRSISAKRSPMPTPTEMKKKYIFVLGGGDPSYSKNFRPGMFGMFMRII